MSTAELKKAERIMHDRFQVDDFRPGQEEVIKSVLDGQNTLAVMPTGSGKSLCYQLPALCEPGLTVVVSPLLALMKDQHDKLDNLGVDVDVFNSATPDGQMQRAMENVKRHRNPIFMVTPERLAQEDFFSWLKSQKVSLFVVDEAHCISQWGHDFRPAFLHIPNAIRALGSPTVLVLTATATDEVIHDIGIELGLPSICVVKTSVYRPNLHYEVHQVLNDEETLETVSALLNETPGPAIIYTATVKEAKRLCEALTEDDVSVALYHGRLAQAKRRKHQDAFMAGQVRVIVATNAFGMGIDKSDVRLLVHAQLPGSLNAYYQESGRAGRDSKHARCVLIHQEKDKRVQQFFLINRYPSEAMVLKILGALPRASDPSVAMQELRERLHDVPLRKLQVALKLLADENLIKRDRRGRFSRWDVDDAIERAQDAVVQYQDRAERDREVLAEMVSYARSGLCRWRMLLEHFGETPDWDRCGHCDSCELVQQTQALENAVDNASGGGDSRESRTNGFIRGDAVRVRRHGTGVIEAVTRERVDIRFPDGRVRRFLPGYVRHVKERFDKKTRYSS